MNTFPKSPLKLALSRLLLASLILSVTPCFGADSQPAPTASVIIPADSSAFVFSPGNWVGDEGREGKLYRQTWNPGAYFRVTWENSSETSDPTLVLDTSTYDDKIKPPVLAANLDGVWIPDLPAAKEIAIPGLKGKGKHVLTVILKRSEQVRRWGTPGISGVNVIRVSGLKLPEGSTPVSNDSVKPWTLIIGDSITEGIGAPELEGYSHLVGQAFQTIGFEYGISASGWSGWLHRGDTPPGDIPGYYTITNSVNGTGGDYDDTESRWNKIDANHSLLDSNKHLSAYGKTGQEPSVILINYCTNDAIHKTNESDLLASMAQGLPAIRNAAPAAHLFLLIPFGQYKAAEIRKTVDAYLAAHPDEKRITIIDLGSEVAAALQPKNGYWGGLHPNPRGHATFAAKIIAQMMVTLAKSGELNPSF